MPNRRATLEAVAGIFAIAATVITVFMSLFAQLASDRSLVLLAAATGVGTAALAALIKVWSSLRAQRKERAKRVFLIYDNRDIDIARRISKELAEQGFEPWLDVEQIRPGQLYRGVIDQALSESGSAVAILTKNFSSSKYAAAELSKALEVIRPKRKDAISVIPVVLGDVSVPEALSSVHRVTSIDELGMKQLVNGIIYATQPTN
jgi:hypothetical protein